MTIYFTSDTHYGHANIIPVCKRPFASVEEMEEAMVANWNRVVQPNDSVYHLGDFFWCNGNKARAIAERLNGKKYWIRGNHDSKDHVKKCGDLFEWVKDYHEDKFVMHYENEDGGDTEHLQFVVMCHYPIYSWNRMVHGSWMLHGHCHASLGTEPIMRYDVGVDYNGMAPISLDALGKAMALRTVVPVDHHRYPPVKTES